jgi:integrase
MQPRYQYGTLTLRKRKKGPAVWQWRYLESGRRKSILIGTLDRFPNKAAALRAAEPYRLKCNLEGPQASFHVTTIGGLVDRYVADELTRRDASGAERLRHNTQKSYLTFINNYIKPAWGDKTLDTVKPLTVEHWLDGIDRSRQTKAHIRNMFHVLFQYAMRVELTAHNPISLVRQSRLRTKAPPSTHPAGVSVAVSKTRRPLQNDGACRGLPRAQSE